MAGLTDRLPLTEGTNRVLDDPAGPSVLGTVASFASDTLQGFLKVRQDEAVKRQQRQKAEEDAREKEATVAAFKAHDLAVGDVIASTVPPAGDLRDPLPDITSTVEAAAPSEMVFSLPEADIAPDLAAAARRVGAEITNVKAAVEQGRMPPISMRAALSGRFNSLLEQYPDQAEHILDIWKKMGIDTALFRQGRDAADQLDEDRESRQRQDEDDRKFEQEMFEIGAKAAGDLMATSGASGGAMTREEVIAHGLKLTRAGQEFELAKREADLRLSTGQLTQQERTRAEGDRNNIIAGRLENSIYNGSNPVINMVQNLSNAILKEPNPAKQAEQWQSVGARIHTMIGNEVEQAVQLAIAGGYTGDTNTLRARMNNQFKRVEDLFSGEFSIAQTHLQALSTISTKMKIDGAEALPVYTTLKGLGMDPATMTGFITGIGQNEDLMKQLRDEVKGFTTDFGRDRASDHMLNIVKLLRGQATLAYMSPGEARGKMLDLFNVSEELSKQYGRGLGGNPDMVLNALGEIAVAANSLTPSSGAAAHTVAADGLLGAEQIRSLKRLTAEDNVDKMMVTATIQAARASGAHVLNDFQTVLPKINEASPYFKVVWDNANGKYKIDDSGKRQALRRLAGQTPSLRGAGAGLETGPSNFARITNIQVPKEMDRWMKAANISLDGVMELKDHDPSTPKGTDLELRNYYGRNIRPKSMQVADAPIDVDKEIDKQFEALERTIDANLTDANRTVTLPQGARSVTGVKGQTVSVPAIAELETEHAANPIFQSVRAAAASVGVPVDIATRLAWVESRFRDQPTNSAGASGPMQVRGFDPKTGRAVHDAETLKIYGKKVADLTPEENIEYGMTYLKQLYEKHGSWNKAIQRYLGNGNDGNLTTEQYASLIE